MTFKLELTEEQLEYLRKLVQWHYDQEENGQFIEGLDFNETSFPVDWIALAGQLGVKMVP